jgi:hypothetical protein
MNSTDEGIQWVTHPEGGGLVWRPFVSQLSLGCVLPDSQPPIKAPFLLHPPLLQRMKAAPSAALGGGALWAKEPPHAAKKAGMLPTSHSAAPQATAGAWQGQLPSRAPSRVSVQPIPEALPPGRGAAWGYGGPTGAVAHL